MSAIFRMLGGVILLQPLIGGVAIAQCIDATVDPNSPLIECTGLNTDQIDDTRSDLTFSVEQNAVITANVSTDLVVLSGDNVSVINNGFVGDSDPASFLIDDAFRSQGDQLQFTNSETGEISGVSTALISRGNFDERIINAGIILTRGTSLSIRGDNHTITNRSTGTIVSEMSPAIDFDLFGGRLNGVIINDGLIQSFEEEAINADILSLTNSGSIIADSGDSSGVGVGLISGDINNSGEILASGDAIQIVGGDIINSGLIQSDFDMGVLVFEPFMPGPGDILDLTILNEGDIIAEEFAVFVEGGESNLTEQTIFHLSGLLSGGTAAVSLKGGNDRFTIGANARLDGDVLLGAGDDSLIVLSTIGDVGDSIFDGGEGEDLAVFESAVGSGDDNSLDLTSLVDFERLDIAANSFVSITSDSGIATSIDELILRSGRTNIETDLSLDTIVLENGVLGGNGSIFGNVTSLGVISPGASIGTLNIIGDLTLNPSSILEIEFAGSEADLVIVNGDVDLDNPSLILTSRNGTAFSERTFNFLTATTVSGAFSDVTLNGFSGIAEIETLPSGIISVTVSSQFALGTATSTNANSTLQYLKNLTETDAETSASDEVISALFALSSDEAALNAGLLSLQPETFAATAAIGVQQAFLATDLIRARSANFARRNIGKHFWLSGSGDFARYEGSLSIDGALSFDVNNRGIIGGAEIVRRNASIGIFGGSLSGDQEFRNRLIKTNSEGFVVGAYGNWSVGPINTIASFAYLTGEAETERAVPFLNEQLRSGYDFHAFTTQAQSRYEIDLGEINVTPVIGLTYVRTDRAAFSESGGAAALEVAGQTEDFLYLDVAGELARHVKINDLVKVKSTLSAGWRYETLGHSIDASAALAGTNFFDLVGTAADFERSRMVVGGDLTIGLGKRFDVFVTYRGEYGADFTDNRINGGVAIRF